MSQIEVQIMGQSYLLACQPGGEPLLQAAADRVDSAMCKIRDAGKVRAKDRIAVLAALNLAFDVNAAQSSTTAALAASPLAASPLAAAPMTVSAMANSDARLSALARKLDLALGADGQLI